MASNALINGDFSRGLYQWDGSGTINRSLGYPRLNCAQLAAGQSLRQAYGISEQILYTLHYFYRLATGATLTAGYGSVTQQHTSTPIDVWREGVLAFSVETGEGNDEVEFSASGGVAYVDTISLIGGGLPKSRSEIAALVAGQISAIATDAGYATTANASGPEGDYSAAIDEALRSNAAMNRWGDPDITLLEGSQVNQVIESAKVAMLQKARASYALETDVTLGPRSESRSQIAGSLDEMLAGVGGNRRISMGPLYREDWRR